MNSVGMRRPHRNVTRRIVMISPSGHRGDAANHEGCAYPAGNWMFVTGCTAGEQCSKSEDSGFHMRVPALMLSLSADPIATRAADVRNAKQIFRLEMV